MSSMIEGIFPHGITSYAEIEALPERLDGALPSLVELDRAYWELSSPAEDRFESEWHVGSWGRPSLGLTPKDQWAMGKGPRLFAGKTAADSGSWIVFGRKCIFVTSGIKWWVAINRPDLFEKVRIHFRDLAKALGSTTYIIYCDNGCLSWDWVQEGKSFEEIEREFVKHGSKRAADLNVLREVGPGRGVTGYYREDLIEGGR